DSNKSAAKKLALVLMVVPVSTSSPTAINSIFITSISLLYLYTLCHKIRMVIDPAKYMCANTNGHIYFFAVNNKRCCARVGAHPLSERVKELCVGKLLHIERFLHFTCNRIFKHL